MATRSIPADWYTTTESLERDRAAVLRLGWQYIGSATDVAEAGSFTTGELGSLPIVITRDGDGTLRGFANVCRHRGALIAEGCGKRRTLQCRYHGWTYKLDGSLHRSPGMTLDEEVRLPEVAVATLGPLLFAAADPDCEPLETALAPFLELLDDVAGVDHTHLVHRRRLEHTIAANWKVVVENFIECYHCPLVHAETLPGYGDDDYRIGQFGPLHTQHLDDQRFCFAYLFPTTQLSAYGGESAFVARTIQPLDDCDPVAADRYIDWFEHVIGEDKPLCESVQRGLASGALDRGYLNPDAESGLAAFQRLVTDALIEA